MTILQAIVSTSGILFDLIFFLSSDIVQFLLDQIFVCHSHVVLDMPIGPMVLSNSGDPDQMAFLKGGALVAQWVKHWPSDLAVPSASPTRGEIFSTIKVVPLHTTFHYHPHIVLI